MGRARQAFFGRRAGSAEWTAQEPRHVSCVQTFAGVRRRVTRAARGAGDGCGLEDAAHGMVDRAAARPHGRDRNAAGECALDGRWRASHRRRGRRGSAGDRNPRPGDAGDATAHRFEKSLRRAAAGRSRSRFLGRNRLRQHAPSRRRPKRRDGPYDRAPKGLLAGRNRGLARREDARRQRRSRRHRPVRRRRFRGERREREGRPPSRRTRLRSRRPDALRRELGRAFGVGDRRRRRCGARSDRGRRPPGEASAFARRHETLRQ